jgi:ubiquinone/menaquinone biosynthesis C-methylase UbiE
LRLVGQALVTSAGERFPIHNRMPEVRLPSDMTGANEKYNHVYETIGGFYDDIQRVVCACSGWDGNAYVTNYLAPLEVKAGDSVLETSVGTGLNFKYLPAGVSLTGIDLSAEMLTNCQRNLRRWQLQADLFLGNAECLPFADESFDVVFHVGGINFFNDRAKAIREMIRVAKPGSRILIADETEEHVKDLYERGPITSFFYRNRKEPVTAPVDLVPPGMLETHLELLKPMGKNRFYVLTFRKPAANGKRVKPEMVASRDSRNDDAALGYAV